MKLMEFVKAAQAANPKAFDGLDLHHVANAVKLTLGQVGKKIGQTENGVVQVGDFGRFNVIQNEVEKDGKKVKKRRVAFRRGPGPAKVTRGKPVPKTKAKADAAPAAASAAKA
jgi:hypothetical protein